MSSNLSTAAFRFASDNLKGRVQWIHILPAGTFDGVDGRGPYIVDDPELVALNSRSYSGKRKIVVDYEHQTDLAPKNGLPAPAAGWIDKLQVRKNGLWAQVDWTQKAATHIANREYRYVSPVFSHQKSGEVVRIIRVALTNSPNLDQLTALARAEENMNSQMIKIRQLLELEEDANDDAVVTGLEAAIAERNELREKLSATDLSANTDKPDPTKFVPIGDFQRAVSEVNKLRQGITQHHAEEYVGQAIASGKMAPFMRDWAIELCTINKSAFDEFLGNVGPAFNAIVTSQTEGLERSTTMQTKQLNALDQKICSQMGINPEDFTTTLQSANNTED